MHLLSKFGFRAKEPRRWWPRLGIPRLGFAVKTGDVRVELEASNCQLGLVVFSRIMDLKPRSDLSARRALRPAPFFNFIQWLVPEVFVATGVAGTL